MREILESKLPMISIENTFPGRGAVLSDNMQGTGELVRLAYEKGHRKIAFIHGEDTSVTRTRLQSFRAVCSELELSIPEAYLRPALYHDRKSAAREAKALLALEETLRRVRWNQAGPAVHPPTDHLPAGYFRHGAGSGPDAAGSH